MDQSARAATNMLALKQRVEEIRAERAAAAERAQAAQNELQNEQDQRVRSIEAGRLIAAGHCDEARANALNSGDLSLAAQVAALCPAK